MKKVFFAALTFAALSFTACGGSAKQEATDSTDAATEKVETTVAESALVGEYRTLVGKVIELSKKVAAGDAAAVAELQTVQAEVTAFAEKNKEAFAKFTETEKAEIEKITKEMATAITGK